MSMIFYLQIRIIYDKLRKKAIGKIAVIISVEVKLDINM